MLAAGVAIGATPRAARADQLTGEASSLFKEGVQLRAEGRPDEACAKFAQSLAKNQTLGPTAGLMLNVAACHEREGKLATARAEFLEAARLYEGRGDEEGAEHCKSRASELAPRLSHLTVRVERPEIEGLVVKRDGRVVEKAAYGEASPVDPGEYVITAEAPFHAPFRTSVLVGPEGGYVEVAVPATGPAARPSPAAAGPKPTAGYVVVGLGGASLAAGAVFGVMALSSNAKAERACRSEDKCVPDDAIAARDRAKAQALAANVGVGFGLAGLVAGGYLLVAAPRGPGASGRGAVAIVPQPGGLGVALRFLRRGAGRPWQKGSVKTAAAPLRRAFARWRRSWAAKKSATLTSCPSRNATPRRRRGGPASAASRRN